MENPAPASATDVTPPADAEKSPDQIEREMLSTRDSITEKVAALESQLRGTIQDATTTVQAVKDVVETAKEAVSTAPSVVTDVVKQSVAAVQETVESFSISECIRNNAWAAMGTSAALGFLTGFFLLGGRRSRRPIAAPDRGEAFGLTRQTAPPLAAVEPAAAPAEPGFFGDLFDRVGGEFRGLVDKGVATLTTSLRDSISTQIPLLVDNVVHNFAERVANGTANGTAEPGGAGVTGPGPARNPYAGESSRVGGNL